MRKEVYKFLSLPFHVQIKKLRELELIEDSDDIRGGIPFIADAFKRAKEQDKVDLLFAE